MHLPYEETRHSGRKCNPALLIDKENFVEENYDVKH